MNFMFSIQPSIKTNYKESFKDLRTNIKSNASPRNNNILSQTTSAIVKNPKIGLAIHGPSPMPSTQQTSVIGPVTNGNKPQSLQHHQQQQQLQQKPISMSDVSDMLFEFYKANTAKAPKNIKSEKIARQQSPPSADGANLTAAIVTSTPSITITPTKLNQSKIESEPHSTTTIITSPSSAAIKNLTFLTASKNVNGDEMVAATIDQDSNNTSSSSSIQVIAKDLGKKSNAPFHPRIKYSNINNKSNSPILPVTNTNVVGNNHNNNSNSNNTNQPIIKQPFIQQSSTSPPSSSSSSSAKQPVIIMPPSVIQSPILNTPPAAAALAAALFRDGYQNFHQQIRAQEQLLKQQQQRRNQNSQSTGNGNNDLKGNSEREKDNKKDNGDKNDIGPPQFPPKYMHNFLGKNNRYSDENYQSSSDEDDDDDEEDEEDDEGKYPEIDDIHLIEGSKSGFANNQMSISMDVDYMSDESHKYSMIAAHALRNLEYSLSDYGGGGGNVGQNGEIEAMYNCRHCGKKYRWKSTLRRHENVECGGKEPSHQCPYCPYKSKQRGNLGVHVRKHHSNLPQLASKRRSKYSQPRD